MRASIIGLAIPDPGRRLKLGREIAAITHCDEVAIESALFAAELCAHAHLTAEEAIDKASTVIKQATLVEAMQKSRSLAKTEADYRIAVKQLGNSGWVIHTIAYALYCFQRFPDSPREAIRLALLGGGDTDTIGAIVGAWSGARVGGKVLETELSPLVPRLSPGPFGRQHLEELAIAFTAGQTPPRWSSLYALTRNLLLHPVIIGHVLRRLLPPW